MIEAIKAFFRKLFFNGHALFPEEPIRGVWPGAVKKGLIYELDVFADAGSIRIGYSGACSSTVADEQSFRDILKGVVKGSYPANWTTPPNPRRPLTDSDLSIYTNEICYIAFVLNHKKKKHWRYTLVGDPIKKWRESPNNYSNLKRMDRNGNVLPGHRPQSKCIAAYFVADGASSSNGVSSYEHYFNLHVDILHKNNGTYVPIVIDPDVRYPGGNEP